MEGNDGGVLVQWLWLVQWLLSSASIMPFGLQLELTPDSAGDLL